MHGVEEPGLKLDPEYLEHPHWGQGAALPSWNPVYQNSFLRGPHAGSAGVKGKNDLQRHTVALPMLPDKDNWQHLTLMVCKDNVERRGPAAGADGLIHRELFWPGYYAVVHAFLTQVERWVGNANHQRRVVCYGTKPRRGTGGRKSTTTRGKARSISATLMGASSNDRGRREREQDWLERWRRCQGICHKTFSIRLLSYISWLTAVSMTPMLRLNSTLGCIRQKSAAD